MMVQVAGAFFAVCAFAVIFRVPRKFLMFSGISGAFGWLVYLLLHKTGTNGVGGIFAAGLAVALLSHTFARIFKSPVTVFLIPGILPLVPGVGMYRIVYYMITNDGKMTAYYLSYTLQIAGAISIAIFIMDTVFRIIWKKV